MPTPRCRHTARRPTSMTRTQGRECSASSVGAILSHRSARVDPLQLGSHGARPAFSFGNWYARAYLLVLSGLAFSPRDPEHQRDQDGHGTNAPEKITLSSKPGSRSANSLASG